MRALLSELALLLLLAAIAVIIRQSESRHKLPTTDDVQNFRKFSSNSTKLSYTWSDCSSSSDSVKILSLSLTPDPPEKGQKMVAEVKLDFMEEVEGGSLNILVRYNSYFPVVNKKKNLCNIPDILQDGCPLQTGIHEATLTQTLPSYALSGTYVATVVAKDRNGNELMCIKLKFSI